MFLYRLSYELNSMSKLLPPPPPKPKSSIAMYCYVIDYILKRINVCLWPASYLFDQAIFLMTLFI